MTKRDSSYLGAEVEVEAEEDAERHADDVVAPHVDVRHERLPSATYRNAFFFHSEMNR
jgi:hypothetical protein